MLTQASLIPFLVAAALVATEPPPVARRLDVETPSARRASGKPEVSLIPSESRARISTANASAAFAVKEGRKPGPNGTSRKRTVRRVRALECGTCHAMSAAFGELAAGVGADVRACGREWTRFLCRKCARTAGSGQRVLSLAGRCDQCRMFATYGPPSGPRQHCRAHKLDTDIDLTHPRCPVLSDTGTPCGKTATFGPRTPSSLRFCAAHKRADDVTLHVRQCQWRGRDSGQGSVPGCRKTGRYAPPGQTAHVVCFRHRAPGDVLLHGCGAARAHTDSTSCGQASVFADASVNASDADGWLNASALSTRCPVICTRTKALSHAPSPPLCFFVSITLTHSLARCLSTQASDDVSSLPLGHQHGPSYAKGCQGEHPQQQAPPPPCHPLPRPRAAQERLPPPLRKECGACGSVSVTHGVPMCEEDVADNGAQSGWCWLQVLRRINIACHEQDESHTHPRARVRINKKGPRTQTDTDVTRHAVRRAQGVRVECVQHVGAGL